MSVDPAIQAKLRSGHDKSRSILSFSNKIDNGAVKLVHHDSNTVNPLHSGVSSGKNLRRIRTQHMAHKWPNKGQVYDAKLHSNSQPGAQGPYMAQRKQQIVENAVNYVTKWIQSKLSLAQITTDTGNNSEAASSVSSKVNTRNIGNNARATKRRKREDEDELGERDDEGDEDQPDNDDPSDKAKEKVARKFACPYYKYDPEKYGDWRQCCGPGWDTVHRVK
jgi:hypothetical protein